MIKATHKQTATHRHMHIPRTRAHTLLLHSITIAKTHHIRKRYHLKTVVQGIIMRSMNVDDVELTNWHAIRAIAVCIGVQAIGIQVIELQDFFYIESTIL